MAVILIRVKSIIWRMSFLEKWQLVNECSVSKVNCGSNTLKSTMYLLLWNKGGIHGIFCHLVEILTKASNI